MAGRRNGKALAGATAIALLLTLQLPPFPITRASAATPEGVTPARIAARLPLEAPRSEAQALNGIAEQSAFGPDAVGRPGAVLSAGAGAAPLIAALLAPRPATRSSSTDTSASGYRAVRVRDEPPGEAALPPADIAMRSDGPSAIVGATTPNLRQISVTYASAMQVTGATSAIDGAHYTLSDGLFIGSGTISEDARTVTLNLACGTPCQRFTAGAAYTLTADNVADSTGQLVGGSVVFTPSDTAAPILSSLTQPGTGTIILAASEPLEPSLALNPVNYQWDGATFPGTVEIQGGDASFCDANPFTDHCLQRVRLTLSPVPAAGSHALVVSSLTDLAGKVITPAPTSFVVMIPPDTTPPTAGAATGFGFTTPSAPAVSVINVTFSEAMSESAGNAANYALQNADGQPATTTGLTGSGGPLTISTVSFDRRSQNPLRFQRTRASLFLSERMAPGVAYRLVISNLADDAGNPLGTTTLTPIGRSDTTPPTVTSVRSSSHQLFVSYSESVFRDANGAGTPTNYTSTDPTLQASLSGMTLASFGSTARQSYYGADFWGNATADSTGVIFTYSRPLPAGTYTVQIRGINDDFGNALSPDPTSVTFTVAAPPALTSLSVTVQDETGAVLSGVYVEADDPNTRGILVANATTNAQGVATLSVPINSTVKVFVAAPFGLLDQWWQNRQTFESADRVALGMSAVAIGPVVLARGAFIGGRVVDSATKRGLDGVSVAAFRADPGDACCLFESAATSIDGGFINLTVRPLHAYAIRLDPAPGSLYVPKWATDATTFETASAVVVGAAGSSTDLGTLFLDPGVRLTGTVLDAATSLGIGGIFAGVNRAGPARSCCTFESGATTASDGTVTVIVHPNRSYKVRFDSVAGGAPYVGVWYLATQDFAAATPVVVGTTDRVLDPVRLSAGVRVTGLVRGPTGLPVPRVGVSAEDPATRALLASGGTPDGRINLVVPTNQSIKFRAYPETSSGLVPQYYNGKRNFERADTIAIGTATTDLGTITLEAGVVFSGIVTDEQNVPLGGAFVGAQFSPSGTGSSCCESENGSTTGADGTFAFVVHANSTYFVFTNGPPDANPAFVPEWYDDKPFLGVATPLAVTTANVALNPIRLAPGLRLTGTITGSGPLANVFVRSHDATTQTPAAPGVSTDTNGRFTLIVPRNRSLKVKLSPPDGDDHLSLWFIAAPPSGATIIPHGTPRFAEATVIGTLTADIDLGTTDLPLGVRLTGAVIDKATKQTIAGAFVNANTPTGSCCEFLFGAQTNSDGRFSLLVGTNASYKINTTVGPTGTPYLAQFYDNKDANFPAADVVAVAGSPFALNTIQLVQGVRLTGTVRSAGDVTAPIGGINVQAFAATSCCSPLGGATTSSDGGYNTVIPADTSFKVMFASTGTLTYATRWNGGALGYLGAIPLTGTAGATVTVNASLTFGFVVSGFVSERSSERPASGVGARLTDAGEGGSFDAVVTRATTDANGAFRLVVQGGEFSPYKLSFVSDRYVFQTWNDKPTWALGDAFTVTADDPAKDAQLDLLVAGTASCVLPKVQATPITIPNAAVDVLLGQSVARSFVADPTGRFSVFGLAASTSYVFRYKGTVGPRIVECYGPLTTDAAGNVTIGTPVPNLQNHTWVSALRINSGDVIRDAITRPHGAVWYRLAIAPQQQVRIDLRNLTRDYSLTVYRDLRQLANAMNAQYLTLAGVRSAMSGSVSADAIDGDAIDGDAIDGDAIDGDAIDGDAIDGDAIDGDAIDGDAIDGNGDGDTGFGPVYSTVQKRGLRALSAKPGLTPESVTFNTRGLTGDLYIRVRGGFSVFDAASLFTLVAQRVTDSSCAGAAFTFHAPTTPLASLPVGKRTLLLTNTAALGLGAAPAFDPTQLTLAVDLPLAGTSLVVLEAIPSAWGQTGWLKIESEVVHYTGYGALIKTFTLDARGDLGTAAALHVGGAAAQKRGLTKSEFLGALAAVASRAEVQGAVFDLADDAGIGAAYADWAATPRCAAQANLVADSVRALIGRARPQNAFQYLVNVGGDHVIPYRRVPDRAEIARESGYSPPVDGTSISESALIGDWFLSDDYYATANPIVRFDHDLYVPDLAIGRLVEAPEDMVAYLRAYTELGGVARPRRALSTGYNFTTDLAQFISGELAKQDDPAGTRFTVDSLISDTWSSADLRLLLFGANRYDILSIQGHFQANRLVPADNGPRIASTELAAVADGRFKGTLFESLGCHSGYNIVDSDAILDVTQPVAWPEALLMRGATGVIGTGYQYGETVLMQNTELLLATLTQELAYSEDPAFNPWGPNGVPIGKALRTAKSAYVAQLASLRGIDEKVIGVSTVYGLPHMRYALPKPMPRPRPVAVTPTTTAIPGLSTLGIAQTYLIQGGNNTNLPTAGRQVFTLRPQDGYYDAGSAFATAVEPYRPIKPKTLTNAEPTFATIPRGAVFLGGRYDETAFSPRLSIPATELAGLAPTYVTPVFLPVRPFRLSDIGGETFVATPFQFRSPARGQGTARIVRTLDARLYYSSLTGPLALVGPPDIRSLSITRNDVTGMLTVVVEVTGQKALPTDAGIADVFITYTSESGPLHGVWASTFTPDGAPVEAVLTPPTQTPLTFSRRYTFTIDPQGDAGAVRLMVQAVNALGEVAVSSNNGAFYRLASAPAQPPVDTRPDTTLAVSAPTSVPFHSILSVSATLQTTGPSPAPVGGRAVTFTFGGNTRVETTDANGVARASFPVSPSPIPIPYPLRAVFLEDSVAHGSSGSADVSVTKGASAFILTPPTGLQYSDGANVAILQVPGPKGTLVPLGEAPVLVTLAAAGQPTRRAGTTTDTAGRVPFDTMEFGGVMPGAYTVSLEFGTTGAGLSPLYRETSAGAFPLTVAPEDGTLAVTPPGPTAAGTLTLRAQVAEPVPGDGAPGDLSRATVEYRLTSTTGNTYSASAHVSPTGAATATRSVAPGVYTVVAKLGTAYTSPEQRFLVPVYDPRGIAAGFGHVITTADGSTGLPLGERASFAFLVFYKEGATTPTGSLELSLMSRTLTLRLVARSFDWLAVNGTHGEFEGAGDIGTASHRFRVIADQGTPGRFEIRIWDATGSFEQPKYRASGPLGSGTIQIHSPSFAIGDGEIVTTATGSSGLRLGAVVDVEFAVIKDGASAPFGALEVSLPATRPLTLRARVFGSLVVSGGHGEFEGTGDIGGLAHRFRVLVDEGRPGSFEIRVWDAAGSFDRPKYRASGQLREGAISVH